MVAAVAALNPLVVTPYVDPDELAYGDVPTASEFEIRNSDATGAIGTQLVVRAATSRILEAERIGEQLDNLDAVGAWAAGSATVLAADAVILHEGSAALRATITALGASSSSWNRVRGKAVARIEYGGGTQVRFWVRTTALTNVANLTVRLVFTNGASLAWNVNTTPTAINAWQEKTLDISSPTSTSGTPWTTAIDGWDFEVFTSAGGAHTGTWYFDDLRIGQVFAWESYYAARKRFRDVSNTYGPWSDYLIIRPSQPPVVAQAVAIDTTDPAPAIDWTFTSPSGKAQTHYRVVITATTGGAVVYDSGDVVSAATVHQVPGELLTNATQYQATVTAYDSDDLAGTWTPAAFTTAFGTPNALASATATPDESRSSIVVGWAATDLTAALFWRYRVYRLDAFTGHFVQIGEVADPAVLTFEDLEAPVGDDVTYAVTVSNGWAESDPATISTTTTGAWWILDPSDPNLIFQLPRVAPGQSQTWAADDESFLPLGRGAPLIVTGEGGLPPTGQLSVTMLYDEHGVFTLLRRAQARLPYVVLKSPFGEVYRVKIGNLTKNGAPAGIQTVDVAYTTVDA